MSYLSESWKKESECPAEKLFNAFGFLLFLTAFAVGIDT
jgi:hypothetical protein